MRCHVCGKKKAAGNIVVGRVMSEFSQSSYLYVPCARGPLCVFWRLLARTPGAMEDMARAREAWSRLAHLGRGDIDAGMFRRTKVCAQERSPIPVSEMGKSSPNFRSPQKRKGSEIQTPLSSLLSLGSCDSTRTRWHL